jgi:SpoVK/Ycf46/Vps4 family AAA+-type ATPase
MKEQEALSLVDTLLRSANLGQRLNDIQAEVFVRTWVGRSYKEIAQQLGYQHDYIKQVGSQLWRLISQIVGEPVSKRNVKAVLRYFQPETCTLPDTERIAEESYIQCQQDWGEAIDVSRFYGRQEELQTLDSWILEDCCRGIGIFGLGGIGKTALSVKLAQQVQSHFDCVIWRSLQQAPSLSTLLSEILPILMSTESVIDCSINALMKQLRLKRCLLVFDNIESILQGGNRSGQYQQGFEAYRQLFDRIFDEPHHSCLMIAGREKPGGFALREGKNLPVRSLQLQGLSGAEGEQLLIAKGLDGTNAQQLALVKYLGGNPLALKLAATTISTLFGGSIQAFLAQGRTVFSDLWDLLDRQFQRLSPLQQQIMYYLAIHREGITPTQLQEEILPKVPWRELLEALESLQERSLIEDERSALRSSASLSLVDKGKGNLTLQPAIKEYVTERFIQTIEREITTCSSVNSSVGIG